MKFPFPPLRCLVLIGLVAPTAARAGFIALDPAATYLHTNQDPANNAMAYSLASLGLMPGQAITLTQVGTYSRSPSIAFQFSDLIAVFSSTNVLLDSSQPDRVPGAIDAGVNPVVSVPTAAGNQATDIAGDFYVNFFGPAGSSVTLVVPGGARYLFFSVDDTFFSDNVVTPNSLFGVNITPASVPEPSSLALCGIAGLSGLGYAWRRRKLVSVA